MKEPWKRERCPVTGKWGYRKRKHAEQARDSMNGGRVTAQSAALVPVGARSPDHRLAVYRGKCCDLWHVGNWLREAP